MKKLVTQFFLEGESPTLSCTVHHTEIETTTQIFKNLLCLFFPSIKKGYMLYVSILSFLRCLPLFIANTATNNITIVIKVLNSFR